MRVLALMSVLSIAMAACDSPPADAASSPGGRDGSATDWSAVIPAPVEEAQAFLYGLVRILDLELSAASGTTTLRWAPQGAVVDDGGAVEVAWFFSAGAPRHREVSPELWKAAAEYVASQRGGFLTKAMPETAFNDGRGKARNTAWTFTRAGGAEPALVVEWRTR